MSPPADAPAAPGLGAPAPALGPAPGPVTIVTTMKNEGAFLLEWVAHYKGLGADHLFIATNDCADPTVEMVQRLEALGLARHHATRIRRGGIQRSALRQARWYPEVTEAEWLLVCDADEFLCVKVGDHSIRALIEASDPAAHEVIGINWRNFGAAGLRGYEDRPVTQRFTRCQGRTGRGNYIKSLFRGLENVARIGIHLPHPRPELGRPFHRCIAGGGPWRNIVGEMILGIDWSAAQMNHYALRGRDSFLVKRERGRVNHAGQDMGIDYWRRFDLNRFENHDIRAHDAATARWLSALMADPVLADLHERAVDWHRGRIAALLDAPDFAALAAAIDAEMAPPPRPPPAIPPAAPTG
ncbi:glycosyltransferase family 2 protein [Phaeovulum vinaykumarii]|uniref:glycosyltransferase family 2 protein n=1 Tax=Phaeovulum vinaykumarii TaxID=407234 RepID=UPI000BD67CB8|nr:glycosyltransferase family 2 protein [Phaeovulum vinaykumarii]SOC07184.1 glycosyl transferase family 2 [Phaeovulum vinaykumarii]